MNIDLDLARAAFWPAFCDHCRSIGFRRPSIKALEDILCTSSVRGYRCEANGNNGIRATALVTLDRAHDRAVVVISEILRTLISSTESPEAEYPVLSIESVLRNLKFRLAQPQPALRQSRAQTQRQTLSPEMQQKMEMAMGLFQVLDREQALQATLPNRKTHRQIDGRDTGCYITPQRKGCP